MGLFETALRAEFERRGIEAKFIGKEESFMRSAEALARVHSKAHFEEPSSDSVFQYRSALSLSEDRVVEKFTVEGIPEHMYRHDYVQICNDIYKNRGAKLGISEDDDFGKSGDEFDWVLRINDDMLLHPNLTVSHKRSRLLFTMTADTGVREKYSYFFE